MSLHAVECSAWNKYANADPSKRQDRRQIIIIGQTILDWTEVGVLRRAAEHFDASLRSREYRSQAGDK